MALQALTLATFDRVVATGLVLVDWWADGCAPCKAFEPIFAAAAARHPEVTFAQVDTDAHPGLAARFRIQAVPTLMAFRDGKVVFHRPGAIGPEGLELVIAHAAKAAVLEHA
jgi:thioredoxin 1